MRVKDGTKSCPRCNGKGWVYYKSYRCPLCDGAKRVASRVFLCEGLAKEVRWNGRDKETQRPIYDHTVRTCYRPATEIFGGKHYCWQHSPADDYAKRRRWAARKRSKLARRVGDARLWRQKARQDAEIKRSKHGAR